MCAKELRLSDAVSGDGFSQVAQTLIKAGSLFGNLDAKEVLPDLRTVSRKVAEGVRASMKPEIKNAIKCCCRPPTTDM